MILCQIYKGTNNIIYYYILICPCYSILSNDYFTFQEEWELVWCYISHWPDILLTLLQQIQAFSTSESSSGNPSESHPKNPSQSHPENPSQSHPKNIIQIHLVGKFLQDLCRCFSGYYNRVRLLPAVSASALPEQVRETMHVRVRLLRALLATMDSAFSIIGVEPLSYM